ncbi:NADH-ubiquinone oxidoreductase subunit, mitochondrial [Grifola frondosa]|uniref:NADH-ubiquinone oxidoreductase subunit, mitochondrial n=1 Tax=Grifola frondosa TaxID=5627 RepID=A0A1C7MJ51_GRIFR|nr:NADH-ubiquinone oxidoreductase subunit, mitochondrial [Grifola frondosa]
MFATRLPRRLNLSRSLASVRSISSTASRRSDALFVHRDTPYNNPKNFKRAQEIISHYPPQYKKAAVIPLLDLGQRQNKGWTSISVMNYVAKLLEMPPMRVYEVATSTQCSTVRPDQAAILDRSTEARVALSISEPIGENFVQGACSNAPMIVVNDDFYEDLTDATTRRFWTHSRRARNLSLVLKAAGIQAKTLRVLLRSPQSLMVLGILHSRIQLEDIL